MSGCVSFIMIELSRENNMNRLKELQDVIKWLADQSYTPHEISKSGTLRKCIDGTELFPPLGHKNLIFSLDRFHKI